MRKKNSSDIYAPVITKSIADIQLEVNIYNELFISRLVSSIAKEKAERRQRVLDYEGV